MLGRDGRSLDCPIGCDYIDSAEAKRRFETDRSLFGHDFHYGGVIAAVTKQGSNLFDVNRREHNLRCLGEVIADEADRLTDREVACDTCSGAGFLHVADLWKLPQRLLSGRELVKPAISSLVNTSPHAWAVCTMPLFEKKPCRRFMQMQIS